MKYLTSPQAWGWLPRLKTSLYIDGIWLVLCLVLALLSTTVRAANLLPYQPALEHYQRFEQGKAPSHNHASHDHEHHQAEMHDAAAHDQQHEVSAPEHAGHESEHDHGHAHQQE